MTETRPEYQPRRAVLPVVSDAEYLRTIRAKVDRMSVKELRATLKALIHWTAARMGIEL